MTNPERSNLDQLKAIYAKGQEDVLVRKATPLEVQERILITRNQLEKLPFALLVDYYLPLEEDIKVKGDLLDQQDCDWQKDEGKLFLAKVKSVFEEVRQWPGFPYQCCDRVAFFLAKKVKEVQVVIGWFRLDQAIGLYLPGWSKPIEPHSWNIDKEGRIIDLTAFQFNEGLSYPLSLKPLVIEGDCLYANRYRRVVTIGENFDAR